jgi:hypothetical protein
VAVDASNFTGGGALVGYTASPTLQGSDRTIDSNPSPSGTTPGTLSGGSSDTSIDFGFYDPQVGLLIAKTAGRIAMRAAGIGPSEAGESLLAPGRQLQPSTWTVHVDCSRGSVTPAEHARIDGALGELTSELSALPAAPSLPQAGPGAGSIGATLSEKAARDAVFGRLAADEASTMCGSRSFLEASAVRRRLLCGLRQW